MILLLLCLVVLDVVVFVVGLWQLEMVWIAPSVSWGYNFAGLGDFGWQLWTWRDFFYCWLLFPFLMIVMGFIALCVYVYCTRE